MAVVSELHGSLIGCRVEFGHSQLTLSTCHANNMDHTSMLSVCSSNAIDGRKLSNPIGGEENRWQLPDTSISI